MTTVDATDYDATVFDLDGTLVRLVVDWDSVADDVAERLRERGVEPPESLWEMLETATETGTREAIERVIASHEREGARRSERLPTADRVPDGPVGVCSLNCEDACRIALRTHGLDDRIDAVVGRDTVAAEKPDPEPLLETIERLEARPAATLFVGDTERDERTAVRAGTDFRYVSDFERA